MPTWKINEYRFYFRVGEPLKKHEPAHIHVSVAKVAKGKIQFWLIGEIRVKKIEGHVSSNEENKIKRIVQEKQDFFLAEWKKAQERIR